MQPIVFVKAVRTFGMYISWRMEYCSICILLNLAFVELICKIDFVMILINGGATGKCNHSSYNNKCLSFVYILNFILNNLQNQNSLKWTIEKFLIKKIINFHWQRSLITILFVPIIAILYRRLILDETLRGNRTL